MLAHHRFHHHFRIILEVWIIFVAFRARKIAIDAHPVHLAAVMDLLLADHRNVVFRLTSDHARTTAGAGVQIHRHRPLVGRVQGRMTVKRDIGRVIRIHPDGLGKTRILVVILNRTFPHQGTPLHTVMVLRQG